ncbi:MAG: neutral zinc metallopeptidase [Deltaproteobacteria bacterium]|nr:neutral zinc metallopeptidase [Deltaproteobacteria bacterium]
MKLDGRQNESHLEDRRGRGGGGGGRRRGLRLGLGGVVVVAVLSVVTQRNLFVELGLTGGGGAPSTTAPGVDDPARRAREEPLKQVALGTFNDAQDLFGRALGQSYRPAKLVLFWDQVDSACGGADAAMGPFYCPGDDRVYIDLGFFDDLGRRFGAPGDFAQAYVIAHEMGHHLQDVLGTEAKVRAAQRSDPSTKNALSVKMELQADCYAGVWGHAAAQRGLLEKGDLEEGLRAAQAVGDDTLQKAAGRAVRPESFTHGSAADRARWFRVGLEAGRLEACDTFGT